MNRHNRAAVPAMLLLLAGCSGAGTTVPAAAVATPAPIDPNAATRAVAQAALLAERTATTFVPASSSGLTYFAAHRASARSRSSVSCTGGFAEQDTSAGQSFHTVVSWYYDTACTIPRQTATFDDTQSIDTTSSTGTVVSFDAAGRATSVETLVGSGSASLRVWTQQSTEAVSAGAPPFGRSSLRCTNGTACTLATVTDGAAFASGVVLSASVPQIFAAGFSATLPFSGSLTTGGAGSIGIVQPSGIATAPTLSGGGSTVAFSGYVTVNNVGIPGQVALTLGIDVGTTHVDGTLANGTTTFAVAGGTTVTVDANGDGAIHYASGVTEKVVDYRITG